VSGHLAEGDLVQFLDTKGRRYQTVLTKGKEFHSHSGYVSHEEVIGLPEGSTVRTTRGQRFVVIRPTLSEFVLKMPRGAQVIYPKDLGPILMIADIVGYELREDFANRARANVEQFLGAEVLDRYRVELRDCYEGIDERDLDRVVLDLPEPWRVVPHAATALRPGGLLVSYTPSIVQVSQLRDALAKGPWIAAETVEVLQRGWYVEDQAVRPDHRMVGHTGFLTHARLAAG
jgi:tRNA (adenine57-N1/adenine58-N1)-methyltransferase